MATTVVARALPCSRALVCPDILRKFAAQTLRTGMSDGPQVSEAFWVMIVGCISWKALSWWGWNYSGTMLGYKHVPLATMVLKFVLGTPFQRLFWQLQLVMHGRNLACNNKTHTRTQFHKCAFEILTGCISSVSDDFVETLWTWQAVLAVPRSHVH